MAKELITAIATYPEQAQEIMDEMTKIIVAELDDDVSVSIDARDILDEKMTSLPGIFNAALGVVAAKPIIE